MTPNENLTEMSKSTESRLTLTGFGEACIEIIEMVVDLLGAFAAISIATESGQINKWFFFGFAVGLLLLLRSMQLLYRVIMPLDHYEHEVVESHFPPEEKDV